MQVFKHFFVCLDFGLCNVKAHECFLRLLEFTQWSLVFQHSVLMLHLATHIISASVFAIRRALLSVLDLTQAMLYQYVFFSFFYFRMVWKSTLLLSMLGC